jgi:tetratricopeptide (TPR) repeat protein
VATKLALAGTALAFVVGVVYSLALRTPPKSSFKISPVAKANKEYKLGINELHLHLNAKEAIKHFEMAVFLDPKFADGYAQLADAWFSIPGESNKIQGGKAAETAVTLDPQSGLARVFFAAAKMFGLDFRTAEEETKRAVTLAPGLEEVRLAAALNYGIMGRTNEALANLKKAIDLGQDTSSNLRVIYSAFVFHWCREYDQAIAIINETPWLKDGIDNPHATQALCYLAKGDYTNSIRLGRQSEIERGRDPTQVNAEFDALEKAFNDGGQEGYWRKKLEMETPGSGEEHWMIMAAIYARLNEPEKAINNLKRAMKETPESFAILIYTDPSFDSLQTDQRFKDLLSELWKRH